MAGEAKTHEPTQLLHVLVPTDGSEASLRAVAHIAGLAECGVAIHVHLLNIQPPLPQSITEFVPAGTVADYHNDEADKALAKAEALLKEHGLAYERHVEVGHAGAKIAEVADELKCDQIVMGTRGLGAITGLLLGSTATTLLTMTSVPVTLIK